MYAPKQKGNVKTQFGYIGRYIRRPAIAVNRIKAYDGQMVTFRYHDKTDGVDKRETLTVEGFIMRLIHIYRTSSLKRYVIMVYMHAGLKDCVKSL